MSATLNANATGYYKKDRKDRHDPVLGGFIVHTNDDDDDDDDDDKTLSILILWSLSDSSQGLHRTFY